ncbi:MAG: hypothetical protein GY869_04635, partial [Planctomycetes bacterium]|nr:hypothetical protein [Planctomycetota bacterium]
YIFERDYGGPNGWGEIGKLIPDDGADYDQFGCSVAIDGDNVVVGVDQDSDNGPYSGSAYIFEKDYLLFGEIEWVQIAKLTADDGFDNDHFGNSVAISGDMVAVGALLDDDQGSDSGSVYLFYRYQGGFDSWGQVKKVIAHDGSAEEHFGSDLDITSDTLIVGAEQDNDNGTNSGSVYLFNRHSGGTDNWGQIAKMTDGNSTAGDNFGRALSISDDEVIVGAPYDDINGVDSGAAFIYVLDADNDGLRDGIERIRCTQILDADTDDDGIPDGDEDTNQNGLIDFGETKPCDGDTDGDGIQDGTELGLTMDDIGSDTNT